MYKLLAQIDPLEIDRSPYNIWIKPKQYVGECPGTRFTTKEWMTAYPWLHSVCHRKSMAGTPSQMVNAQMF